MTDRDKQLVVALRIAQWELDDVAHGIPSGHYDRKRLDSLADALETLADLLRNTAAKTTVDQAPVDRASTADSADS